MFGSDSLIEDEFKEPYAAWKQKPGQESNAAMLKALHPVIEGAVRTHVGAPNPLLMSRGRLMALQGLKSYDPGRGRLTTHLYNQLQGLKRVNRQQTTIVKVPERVSLDRYHLESTEEELRHTLGREPTDDEIADHTGFSTKRLARVRSYRPAVAEGLIEDVTGGVAGGVGPVGARQALHLDLVYDELDPYQKKIFEHTLGYNGRPVLSNQELSARLKRSPGAVSQAKLRIQQRLDEAEGLLGGL